MKIHPAIALLFLLTGVGFAVLPQKSDDKKPLIRAQVDVVNVLCTVRDRNGKGDYIEGLKKEEFDIYEDGVRQNLQFFSYAKGEEADPLSVVLLIDVSGSVKDKLAFERKAALEFLEGTLRKNKDLASVVEFHEEIRLLQDFTYDLGRLAAAIEDTRAGGGTKLYDALFLAADELLRNEVGRRVAVVVSDGDDTLSEYPKKEAIRVAQEQDVVIYGIGVQSARFGSDFGALKDFAKDTGGLFVNSESRLDRIREAFGHINQAIKNQYSLGYISTNKARDGAFRKVQIRVKRSGLNVTHRKGYYADQSKS